MLTKHYLITINVIICVIIIKLQATCSDHKVIIFSPPHFTNKTPAAI
jgi:hypothetical protein